MDRGRGRIEQGEYNGVQLPFYNFHSPTFHPQRASALICVPPLEDLYEDSLSLRRRRFHRRVPALSRGVEEQG